MDYYKHKMEVFKAVDKLMQRGQDFNIENILFNLQKDWIVSRKMLIERINQNIHNGIKAELIGEEVLFKKK